MVALWNALRPVVIVFALGCAIASEVLIATLITGGESTVLAVIVGVALFFPLWFGAYTIVAFPINFMIGFARWTDDEGDLP